MQRLDGELVHAATDLNNFTECLHLVALTRGAASGGPRAPDLENETAELLAKKGDEHERRYLQKMREVYGAGVVAFEDRPEPARSSYIAAERASLEAMASGAHIIYQATFFDGTFLGRADFLRRVEVPSANWPWSYEVIDTKLALSPKPHFLVQLCHYSEHVTRLQGVAPKDASIVLGNGAERSFRVEAFAPYYRRLKAAYLTSVAAEEDAYPLECAHCDLCAWRATCAKKRDEDDHLSLVAGMRRDQIKRLGSTGIETLGALAVAQDAQRPKAMALATFENLRAQAAEQHRFRIARASGSAVHSYRFRPYEEKAGLTRLPEPQPGDIFFDMEGDPMYRPGASLEYLFGSYLPDEPEGSRYLAFWGTDPDAERLAFERFVDFVVARRRRYPKLHVYHYAPYETTALGRLSGRFGSREEEVDDFLRSGVFVDLYPIVRQALWISQPSYSIKKVEALYGFERATQTRGGDDSIVMFESWLDSQNPEILEDIERYNEDDCLSTYRLREWLIARVAEYNQTATDPIPWCGPPEEATPPEDPDGPERAALMRALLDGIGTPASEEALRAWPEDRAARWLLGNLLQYHKREAKPEYWEFFHRRKHPTELVEDRGALGGLTLVAEIPPYRLAGKRNTVYTYSYPDQEFDQKADTDVDTGKSVGVVVSRDEEARRIAIQVASASDPHALRGLILGRPLPTNAHRSELLKIGTAYLAGTLGTSAPATKALLLRGAPYLIDREPGSRVQPEEISLRTVSATVAAVRDSALVIQGPPGTGKSTSGAHAILDLLARGKRVAMAALGHHAVHSLCHKIEEVASERGVRHRGTHRSSTTNPESRFRSRSTASWICDAGDDFSDCDLVSGAVYGWALALEKDPSLAGSFDVLVFDEAGQISLADALIVSRLARSVVLLGDPQQLPQVSKGSHPLGVSASILEHVLGADATIAPDRGLFLDRSYRLEPRIARYVSTSFYDGRLHAASKNVNNRIESRGLAGGGLRFAAIDHETNARRSREEALRIADEIAKLLTTGTAILREGSARPLTERDILVVTPYNAQRLLICKILAERGYHGVAVGTVDKFQGQEAPVVLYSMATSTADLAPRGLDFLLSPNRFNVAISRAEALAFVACSPLLLSSRATSIESMQLLSMLCGFVENATPNPTRPPEPLRFAF